MTAPSEDPMRALERGLADIKAFTPPARLYRFFGESSLSSFTEGKLRLTPPSEFNDPFEIYAGLSEEGLTEEAVLRSVLNKNGLFRTAVKENGPGYDLAGMGFEEQLIAAVKSEPKTWRLHLKSQADAIASSCAGAMGISCFSAFTPEELHGELGIHHWAMYGGQHRGFVIGYDGTHPLLANCAAAKWLFPVEYVDRRVKVELAYFDEWSDEKLWLTIRTWSCLKSRLAWGHEREWRLMLPINAAHPMPGYTKETGKGGIMSARPFTESEYTLLTASLTDQGRLRDKLIVVPLLCHWFPHQRGLIADHRAGV